jgi:DnaJ-like protein
MMNLNSKYFDRIRINPDGEVKTAEAPTCEWHGCAQAGGYRAPKGRHQEGKYFNFCLDHVKEYNKSYNYFAGMGDEDIIAYQRSAATGHRPTWSMGVRQADGRPSERPSFEQAFVDPFGLFGGTGRRTESEPERRPLKNLERRSFAALNLEGSETAAEIKSRYKELVKRLHPDANGGDRSSEDRLRQIIQAYHYLRSAGFC